MDTSPVIYFIEASSRYGSIVATIFQPITSGTLTGITSVITLGEALVRPVRNNDARLQ